ncbi:MAG: acyl-CoA thioesterase [Planctomycetes bacterium]|nr:acyl-CoA thioesterase [Planctomycetota bacterium]
MSAGGAAWRTRLRYRFGDIDDAGIAYYPKLLHYFHCAFEDWWSDGLGRPYPTVLHEDKLGLPAVKLEAEFFAPVRYGDEPWVHLGVLRIGRSSVEFAFWMTRGDDPAPLCRMRVITAAVDMDSMQGRPLPDVWRERFAAFAIAEAEFPSGRS